VKGILYIVSTPIGNLEDITARALRILGEVDIIAAEDTRRSLKLLNHYGISKPLISYWKEKERSRAEELVRKLLTGQSVALISDAGTPGISDPGAILIKMAIEENVPVVSIPGPSACIAALSLSGLPTDQFAFIGFLPPKQSQRKKILTELSLETKTMIFYEAPHRILETLVDMEALFPGRRAALVKELTKMHEEVLRGNISEILANIEQAKIAGEFILIIEGKTDKDIVSTEDALVEVHSLLKKGLGRKEAVKKIADQYGLCKKELYDRSLNEST
jgi:16S rRNA (cytidine1402-2'-O)-methyltransferase